MPEIVACNLCGNAECDPLYRKPDVLYYPNEWFDIVLCRSCDLAFVSPRPKQDEMKRFYPPEYFDLFFAKRPKFTGERHLKQLKSITGLNRNASKRLLDIGCANGDFPRLAIESGWQAEGLETAENVALRNDVRIYRSLETISTENQYDIITAWGVLEYLHDPMAYFKGIADHLAPNGAFVFAGSNLDSISARHLFGVDTPRALHIFGRKAIEAYARRNGLVVESMTADDTIYGMTPIHWLRYFMRRSLGLRPLRWEELPETPGQYLRRKGIPPSFKAIMNYALSHPLTALDRALAPAYAKLQMLCNNYGIANYTLRKRIQD